MTRPRAAINYARFLADLFVGAVLVRIEHAAYRRGARDGFRCGWDAAGQHASDLRVEREVRMGLAFEQPNWRNN